MLMQKLDRLRERSVTTTITAVGHIEANFARMSTKAAEMPRHYDKIYHRFAACRINTDLKTREKKQSRSQRELNFGPLGRWLHVILLSLNSD